MVQISNDEIVISGIDLKFPKSKNMEEFGENLYNKVDMATYNEVRWSEADYPTLPKRKFLIDGLEKFDASLFKMHKSQVEGMDPQGRILLEQAYSALLDAGVHPATLRGSNTGVFAATCYNDTMAAAAYTHPSKNEKYSLTGNQSAFLANHVSYALNLRGPSFTLDSACSSAMYALLQAVNAMRLEHCDSALVLGSNLVLNANLSTHMQTLGVLSNDGFCHSFDHRANGYVRADAISAMFLQKRKDARRVYADIVHILGNNDGYKVQGPNGPSNEIQAQLFKKIYSDVHIDPSTVDYIEAHATGTLVGDLAECTSIDNIFCKGRNEPLLVGATKPNMGHSEATSALSSIAKVIHAFETGLIPPTIHQQVREDIPALKEGRLKVCSETTVLPGPLVAVNSFGVGGSNAHVLLRRWSKAKSQRSIDKVPRLVFWSGRTEEAVLTVIDKLKSTPVDPEFIGLLHGIQKVQIPENLHRGFCVLEDTGNHTNPSCLSEYSISVDGTQRPIVWVFPGLGSQWTAMGKSLMQIQPFYDSIMKCHNILKRNVDFDLINVITSEDKTIIDSILNSITSIGAIQAALVDVLKMIEIPFDWIIGHSAGDIICAYADGAITLEQAILSAYYKGKVSSNEPTIVGAMAAVGLGYNQVKKRLPPSVYAVCHNSTDSCTISGPKKDVFEFTEQLKSERIFAKVVPSQNIAFHSKYIAHWREKYYQCLKSVLPKRTRRSPKWISSSIPLKEWDLEYAKYNTAEYHVNNMLGSVYFEESCSALPQNAIIIEVSPHGMFQSILRTTFPNATYIPLAQRGNQNNAAFFMSALGKLFLNGVNMNIERLYAPVEFPVSRATPMISPLIKYDHEHNWHVPKPNAKKSTSFERNVTIDISSESDKYLANHVVNDRIMMVGASYIYLVWETLAHMSSEPDITSFNVEFNSIRFRRATTLSPDMPVHFTIVIQTTGNFELTENGTVVVSGNVKRIPNDVSTTNISVKQIDENSLILSKKFIYTELILRGYKFKKEFRSLNSFCVDNNSSRLQWNGHWDAFIDGMSQVFLIAKNTRMLQLPTSIKKIRINAIEHLKQIEKLKDVKKKLLDVVYCEETNTILSGGIEIKGLEFKAFERRKPSEPELLETCELIPFFDYNSMHSLHDVVRICVQFVIDKSLPEKIQIMEALNNKNEPIIEHFREVFSVLPRVNATYKLVTNRDIQIDSVEVKKPDQSNASKYSIVIANGENNEIVSLFHQLSPQGVLISVKHIDDSPSVKIPNEFSLVAALQSDDFSFSLFQRKSTNNPEYKVISVNTYDKEYSWVRSVQEANETDNLVLVADRDKISGLIGLLNHLRFEIHNCKYQSIIIDDNSAPAFDIENSFYKTQLSFGFPYNVYRDGKWGTYRFLTLKQGEKRLPPSTPLRVEASLLGNLETLEWVPTCENQLHRIKVCYAGLTTQDIKLATAEYLLDDFVSESTMKYGWFGREFSGIATNGERVMGVSVSGGALATEVSYSSNDFIFKVPSTMSLQDAATIPIAYLSVYSAFFVGGQISSEQTILIDGTNYIGLAAIRIALAYGLQVFVVVSSEDDKYQLLHYFPELNDNNISSSFDQIFINKPIGLGLDFALSSSSGDHIEALIEYLDGGTLFSIEPFTTEMSSHLGQKMFEKGIAYRPIFLDAIAKKPKVKSHLIELVNQDLELEVIRPLPASIFKSNEVKNAFQFMFAKNTIDKILVELPTLTEFSSLNVKSKFVANSNGVYIITGGLGAIGLELAYWMIRRGVRNLVISSRRNTFSAYEEYRLNRFRLLGCKIVICTSDITTFDGCKDLLELSLQCGPVHGIFNLAGVLIDSLFSNQTAENFQKSFDVKAQSALYLDELSRTLCPQLRHFVGFSSVSPFRGTGGQSNYAMSNFSLDRMVENRIHDGLPGVSIQWGPIADVGMAAKLANGDENFEIAHLKFQRIDRCLHVLDELLFTKNGIVSSCVIPDKKHVEDVDVFSRVLRVFGIKDLKKIPISARLVDLGMDSMIVSEVKQILEREVNISLSPGDIRVLSIDELKKITGST